MLKVNGLSLVELICYIAISSILMLLAINFSVPYYYQHQISYAVNLLQFDLQYARNISMLEHKRVLICPLTSLDRVDCNGKLTNWSNGWVVLDKDYTEILYRPLNLSSIRINSGNIGRVQINSNGLAYGVSNQTFKFFNDSYQTITTCLVVSPSAKTAIKDCV